MLSIKAWKQMQRLSLFLIQNIVSQETIFFQFEILPGLFLTGYLTNFSYIHALAAIDNKM